MFSQLSWIFTVFGISLTGFVRDMNCQTTNLTAITWDHAVNSQEKLRNALASDIDYIEADIVLGHLIDDTTQTMLPVMGHPPANTSDITLEAFLTDILNFNTANPSKQKGVKLDFKSIEVFEGSLSLLRSLWSSMTYPVWINADIVRGPVNNVETVPVNPIAFLRGCKDFPGVTLSVGWTTLWGADYKEGSYTDNQVQTMITALQSNNVSGHPITFPIRAGIAANSLQTLSTLYEVTNQTNPTTFTIWSSADDAVDVEKLRKVIFHFGLDRVYVDVPDNLKSQLRLDEPQTNSAVTSSNLTIFQWIKYVFQLFLSMYIFRKRF